MGGVLKHTYRKIESFLACELKMTIKYVDQEQCRRVALILLNCRVHLPPNPCDTFLKFMRITYSLGDVVITRTEAIEVYVAILRHLYGKKTTMETLIKMGRISNKRNLESKVVVLKQLARKEQEKINDSKAKWNQTISRVTTNQTVSNIFADSKYALASADPADIGVWTSLIDRQLINLYINCMDLQEIKEFMEATFEELFEASYQLQAYEARIASLTQQAFLKVMAGTSPEIANLSDHQTEVILKSAEGDAIRR
jgi:hypothetical protein